jgi:type II secretory pathway pseudopilin PulG
MGRDTVEFDKYNKSMNLAGQGTRPLRGEGGYAMAALLVGLAVMSVLMSMAMPVWSHMVKREKEEELIWRGKQYARAVGLFQRKYANAYPPTVDVLVEQRFLRKKYKDPITNDDFQLIPAGGGATTPGMPGAPARGGRGGQSGLTGPATMTATPGTTPTANITGAGQLNLGISGVVSKSKDQSIKIYNGRQKYNEWTFVYIQTAQQIGLPGAPGNPGSANPFGVPGSQFPGGRGGPPMAPGGRGPFPGGRGFQGMPGTPPQVPFGQPGPFGQPPGAPGSFGQPQPFGNPGQPQRPPPPPARPPGN